MRCSTDLTSLDVVNRAALEANNTSMSPHLCSWSPFAGRLPAWSTIANSLPDSSDQQLNTIPSAFASVKWSAKFFSPGTHLIFTLPELVISCTHQDSQLGVSCLPQGPSRRYRLGSVGVCPRSELGCQAHECIGSCSTVPVSMAWFSDSATVKARVACVLEQCFATIPYIIMPPLLSTSFLGLLPRLSQRGRQSSTLPPMSPWTLLPSTPSSLLPYLPAFAQFLTLFQARSRRSHGFCRMPCLELATRQLAYIALAWAKCFGWKQRCEC